MTLQVVQFPKCNALHDVPAALRELADEIEAGNYGACHNLAWVVDGGDGDIRFGLMGQAAQPGLLFHFLLAVAMNRVQEV